MRPARRRRRGVFAKTCGWRRPERSRWGSDTTNARAGGLWCCWHCPQVPPRGPSSSWHLFREALRHLGRAFPPVTSTPPHQRHKHPSLEAGATVHVATWLQTICGRHERGHAVRRSCPSLPTPSHGKGPFGAWLGLRGRERGREGGTGGAGLAGDAELRRSHLEPLHLEPSPRWAVSADAPAPPAGVSARYSGSFCVDYVWIFKASLRGGPPVIPTWREGRPPHVGDTWKVAGVASWCVRMNPAAASKPHSPPPSFVHQQEPRGLPGTRRGHGGRATHHLGERSSTGRCTALTKRGHLALVAAEVSKRGQCNRPQPWI
uniref:uncharacterized protein LOC132672492 n=1 Tax=Panthera onca TaxID=9690 RepID=UPI002955B856|nr:uncharacterized protein LOC132672492 [Panthera onca]